MKRVVILFIFLMGYSAYSQSLSVFNIDGSGFPIMNANFFAFDRNGNQISNLSISDFEIKENGISRLITNVSCPNPQPPISLSSVLVMDISGSMTGNGLDIAKAAANAWINMLPLGRSDCAVTSFSDHNYMNQDFTIKKSDLSNAINNLVCLNGTDYNAAMIDSMSGGILVAKKGKNKRVIVFLSDGEPNTITKTTQIINEANADNITIYCVTFNISAPQCMKDIAEQTGGMYFENIITKEAAEECYRKILITAQGGNPCRIDWKGGTLCKSGMINLEVKLIPENIISTISYSTQNNNLVKLEFDPIYYKFTAPQPGIKTDKIVKVIAKNGNFDVTNVTSSNNLFSISPKKFTLNNGESIDLTVSYIPIDSGYAFSKFTFENDNCPAVYYVSGGFPGRKPSLNTLKLLEPNGGEIFSVGSDTTITWEGVLPDEKVFLEYSTNNGITWLVIADSVNGLIHKWHVPKTPSDMCLARVSSMDRFIPKCQDVLICEQLWMGCNLEVDHYRNGDSIPEVRDPAKWSILTTGAWCYYNNDPNMGPIYGKLYNWYAVNDPRGLAPGGWHIASDPEWTTLENCMFHTEVGGQLKSTGTIEGGDGLWYRPNTGASNITGFSAVPSAYRTTNGIFDGLGIDCTWWTSSYLDGSDSWLRYIGYDNASLYRNTSSKKTGFAVRCLKD